MRNKIIFGVSIIGLIAGLVGAYIFGLQRASQPPVFKPASSPYQTAIFANGIIESDQSSGSDINIYPEVDVYKRQALDRYDNEGHRQWSAINTLGDHNAPDIRDLAKHLSIPPAFLAQLRAVIQPGTTLVVSDIPMDRGTPIESGVNILTTDIRR